MLFNSLKKYRFFSTEFTKPFESVSKCLTFFLQRLLRRRHRRRQVGADAAEDLAGAVAQRRPDRRGRFGVGAGAEPRRRADRAAPTAARHPPAGALHPRRPAQPVAAQVLARRCRLGRRHSQGTRVFHAPHNSHHRSSPFFFLRPAM